MVVLATSFLSASLATAQPLGAPASRSFSGQFVVVNGNAPRIDPRLAIGPGMVELNRTLLPVSCERIKQYLYREIAAPNVWHSKIFLELHSAALDGPAIVVACDRYVNAWQYRVSLPVPVDRTLFVRAIVQVLLTEIANRQNVGPTAAEVPAWLIEGLTAQIMASRQAEVILGSPTNEKDGVAFTPTILSKKEQPLKRAHEILRVTEPLNFEALSWPAPEQVLGSAPGPFSASAQLFVARLQQLPRGRDRLRMMVELLPACRNWQFAFFEAFSPHFQKTLDVEKWWTLQLVHFTGRELGQWWPLPESCIKLRETLQVPVHIHQSTNGLPAQGQITLQAALRQWRPGDQHGLMQQKAHELEMLRLRVAPDLVSLVEDYRRVLSLWLEDNTRGPVLFGFGRRAAQSRAAAQTAQQLDLLDQRLLQIEKPQ
jgi:hypothetical protein